MKTRNDPRHQHRINLMQDLFTWDFDNKQITPEIEPIIAHLKKIDQLIQESAPERPLAGINKIDLSILRLAVFEMIIKKDAPIKVVVDEAVEMGKEFGSNTSASFINGVLGKVIEQEHLGKK